MRDNVVADPIPNRPRNCRRVISCDFLMFLFMSDALLLYYDFLCIDDVDALARLLQPLAGKVEHRHVT